jgi:hypothetical protein
VPVAGYEVRAGTIVVLCTAAANREAGVHPDRFDVCRFTRRRTPGSSLVRSGPALLPRCRARAGDPARGRPRNGCLRCDPAPSG